MKLSRLYHRRGAAHRLCAHAARHRADDARGDRALSLAWVRTDRTVHLEPHPGCALLGAPATRPHDAPLEVVLTRIVGVVAERPHRRPEFGPTRLSRLLELPGLAPERPALRAECRRLREGGLGGRARTLHVEVGSEPEVGGGACVVGVRASKAPPHLRRWERPAARATARGPVANGSEIVLLEALVFRPHRGEVEARLPHAPEVLAPPPPILPTHPPPLPPHPSHHRAL